MPEIPIGLLSAREEGRPSDLPLAALLYLPCDDHLGQVTPPALRAPGLVVGHGAGSRASRHREFCLEACRQGFVVLAPDFRGHGGSEGRGDGPLELDVLAATTYLRGHPVVDPRLVCYRGSSMGGFYGLKAARQAAFAAMVLLCTASETTMLRAIADTDAAAAGRDTEAQPPAAAEEARPDAAGGRDDGSGDGTPRWDTPAMRAYFARQSTRALAREVDCPVLLVHARDDGLVPFEHSLMLTGQMRAETTLLALQGGSHTSAQHDPAIHQYCAAWLAAKVAVVRVAEAGTQRSV